MTALAAIFDFKGSRAVRDDMRHMLASQSLYGRPQQTWVEAPLAIGRNFYPSLPEDRFDRSIIVAPTSGLVLAADVRLDNRPELAESLALGRAGEMSDAAIVLAAFERWDEQAVARLIGDFALILWNPRTRSLLLARDFLGNRPLHFHRSRDFLAVASMPKGLHALADVPRAPDPERLLDLLALVPPAGTETCHAGIERVEPAHYMLITRERTITRRFWTAPAEPIRLPTPSDYGEALREHLDRAVAARLRSLGGVGSQLSGGLDSGAVTASAAIALRARDRRLSAFTAVPRAGFRGPAPANRIADEGPLAARSAAQYPNIDHVLVDSSGRSLIDVAERYIRLNDRPPVNLCNGAWGEAIHDEAKARGVTVLLTAQGGNMTISYDGKHRLAELLANGAIGTCLAECWKLVRAGTDPARVLWMALAPLLPSSVAERVRSLLKRPLDLDDYSVVSTDPGTRARLAERAAARGLDFRYRPWGTGSVREWVLRRTDFGNYAKGTLAGWGIDLRDPTTDRRLVEFCWAVPDEQYLRDGRTRALARSAFAARLPGEVLQARRHGLQGADWYMALECEQERVREEVARLGMCPDADRILDLRSMENLAAAFPVGRWHEHSVVSRYRLGLLRGIAAGSFLRGASGSNH